MARSCISSGGLFTVCPNIRRTRNSISIGVRFLSPTARPIFWRSYGGRGEFERPHLRVLSRQYNWSRIRCRRGAVTGIRLGWEISPRDRPQSLRMDEPVDYREVADYLSETRGMPSVEIKTPYRSTWLDNSKAKFLLGWRPRYDLKRLIEEAWAYRRSNADPRRVWYPG